MAIPKPKLNLPDTTLEDELPSEVMAEQGIAMEDYGDFLKAVRAVILQSQGASFTEAINAVSIPKNARYSKRWPVLFTKASALINEQLTLEVRNLVSSIVTSNWPTIMQRMVNIAKNGSDRDSIEAAKFLHEKYISPAMESAPSDEEQAVDFLKRNQGFNPMTAIHAGTILGIEQQTSAKRELE